MKTFKILAFSLTLLLFGNEMNAQSGVLNTESSYSAHAKGWMVDINKAYEESQRTGKPIMANFTGSDWCGWCIKLKREVFDKAEFKAWAKDNVVLLEVDAPRRFKLPQNIQEQNQGLQQAFSVSGYPTIWVFDLNKDANNQFSIDALGKTGYVRGGPSAFNQGIEQMITAKKNN